jgi:MFS family permease
VTTAGLRGRISAAGSSLRVRNYRLYFIGQSVSVAGTFMQMLALSFLTLRLTDSGADLGIVAGARVLPFVLLGPMGGVLADRHDKRRILYITQTSLAAAALAFAVLDWTGLLTFPIVIALSLLLGGLTVLDNPARQSFIVELVDRDTLANAVVLNSISLNVARMIGSVAGGALVAAVGIPWCFVLNAVTFAAVLSSLAMMRAGEMTPAVKAPRRRGQVREGLSYAVRTPELAWPLLMVTVTGVLAYEFPVTLPLLATDAFGGDATTYGVLAAVMAVGSIGGGLVAASRPGRTRPSAPAVAAVGWGIAITGAALAPDLPLVWVALVFVGYGSITFNAAAKTTLQLGSRPEMRGRVMALWSIAWSGSTVVGGPLVGWIAAQWGSRWGLLVGGVPTVLLGVVLLPVLRRRDRLATSTS